MRDLEVTPEFETNEIVIQTELISNVLEEEIGGSGGGGGAVQSVNGKTGIVLLDAGDLGYSELGDYGSGTVGNELTLLSEGQADLAQDILELEEEVDKKADQIVASASGAVASFTGKALKSLIVSIEPVQSGSGDPSPENVRPISGWTGANGFISPTLDGQDGTAISVNWQPEAGTVYGGTLDVTNGVLVVTHVSLDVTALLSHAKGSSTTFDEFYYRTKSAVKPIAQSSSSASIRSNVAVSGADSSANFIQTRLAANQPRFIFPAGTMPDVTAFDDWVNTLINNGNTPCFWYELLSPVTYQLTPTEVRSLLGANNIWFDCGDTSVEYCADTKDYIDKVVGDIESALAALR